jgi:hypothetical protein
MAALAGCVASGRAGKPLLAPGFEDGHGHGIAQVQAALAGAHRQAQALRLGEPLVAVPA